MKSLILVFSLLIGSSAFAQSRTVAGFFSDELDYRLNQVIQRIDENALSFNITHSDVSELFGKKCRITIDPNFDTMNGVEVFEIRDREDKHFGYYSITPSHFTPELSGELTVTTNGDVTSYLKSNHIDLNFLAENSKCHSKSDFVELLERRFPKAKEVKASIYDDERTSQDKLEGQRERDQVYKPSSATQK